MTCGCSIAGNDSQQVSAACRRIVRHARTIPLVRRLTLRSAMLRHALSGRLIFKDPDDKLLMVCQRND